MRSGKLRHRITIERPGQTQDPDTGEILPDWTPVATVWASVEPLSAREFIAADAGQSKISAKVVMRYRSGIDATMRLLHRGQAYNIHAPLPDPESGRHYLTLPVSMGTNDGD
ncbi:phage head closure protein [Oceanisphaera sediminis]|uniref:Phage head closure protein n=1 Tax=Oceanisphaera sediminis TaxID=981381 RepID=A0ABP7EM08_9GAMM